MASRPELPVLRDVVVRYFHRRASLDEVRDSVLDVSRLMKADGLPMEEILVVLKGAVTIAAEQVTGPSTAEGAVALRAKVTPWLISIYMNPSGEFDEPADD